MQYTLKCPACRAELYIDTERDAAGSSLICPHCSTPVTVNMDLPRPPVPLMPGAIQNHPNIPRPQISAVKPPVPQGSIPRPPLPPGPPLPGAIQNRPGVPRPPAPVPTVAVPHAPVSVNPPENTLPESGTEWGKLIKISLIFLVILAVLTGIAAFFSNRDANFNESGFHLLRIDKTPVDKNGKSYHIELYGSGHGLFLRAECLRDGYNGKIGSLEFKDGLANGEVIDSEYLPDNKNIKLKRRVYKDGKLTLMETYSRDIENKIDCTITYQYDILHRVSKAVIKKGNEYGKMTFDYGFFGGLNYVICEIGAVKKVDFYNKNGLKEKQEYYENNRLRYEMSFKYDKENQLLSTEKIDSDSREKTVTAYEYYHNRSKEFYNFSLNKVTTESYSADGRLIFKEIWDHSTAAYPKRTVTRRDENGRETVEKYAYSYTIYHKTVSVDGKEVFAGDFDLLDRPVLIRVYSSNHREIVYPDKYGNYPPEKKPEISFTVEVGDSKSEYKYQF